MNRPDDMYWFGSYLQLLIMIALLVNIWMTKNCSGISLKSQFLYALVFTMRHRDFEAPYLSPENTILKIAYITVTYATVLSIVLYFQKTYEKQNDTTGIGIFVTSCFVIALFVNGGFNVLEIFMAFSVYLEAIAMLPQFQFVITSKTINRRVILYIVAMAAYTLLYIAYLGHLYYTRPFRNYFEVAAATIQLLLYCSFFFTIYPWLNSQDQSQPSVLDGSFFRRIRSLLCFRCDENRCQPTVARLQAKDENQIDNTGFLVDNVSNVVLSHSSFVGVHSAKANPTLVENTIEKS